MGLSIFWKIYGTSKSLASNEGNCGFKEMLYGGSHLLTTLSYMRTRRKKPAAHNRVW